MDLFVSNYKNTIFNEIHQGTRSKAMKYATRINSFLRTGCSVEEALRTIGRIDGVDYVDMNYPEHFRQNSVEEVRSILKENGLKLNAINLRFREEYLFGIFDNKDEAIRMKAVELCKEAAVVCNKLNGMQCIVWLGFDGFEYSFQKDYVKTWTRLVSCFREVCTNVDCRVSIEYKPYEERGFATVDSWGATWKLISDVGCENFGATLDMCHMLMKKENPAFAAALFLNAGKLTVIHINDGEGSFDDGMMVGSVHPFKTFELMYYLKKYDYQDVIYFDTFPKREDAVKECELNVLMCKKLEQAIERIGLDHIAEIIDQEDGSAAVSLMAELLR